MTAGTSSWGELRDAIVSCRRCPRLVAHRERTGALKTRAHRAETYWARPVPGFGDPNARLLIVGLAPSAQGANRTGRIFTGDKSAAFLVAALYRTGFASQPTSTARGDGLHYADLYVSAAVRCVPPDNRPTPEEQRSCRPFLAAELRRLERLRAVLCLGGIAWEATLAAVADAWSVERPRTDFRHGVCVPLGPGKPLLFGGYHPSPQNTNTGRLTPAMFDDLLERIRASYSAAPDAGGRRH